MRPPNAVHMARPGTATQRNEYAVQQSNRDAQQARFAPSPNNALKTQRAPSKLDNVEIYVPPPKNPKRGSSRTARPMTAGPNSHR